MRQVPFAEGRPAADPSQAEAGHADHEHGDGEVHLLSWLGKFHPPATHLPIGLILGAAIAEAITIFTRREAFRTAAAYCVALGALAALGAAGLGWVAGGFHLTDDDWVQTAHRWLGTGTATLAMVAALLSARRSSRPGSHRGVLAFRLALFAAAGLIGVSGFFGGALVYGLDHYAW